MKNQSFINCLIMAIGVLALVAAGVGVFWQGTGQTSEFLTLYGETVTLQGRGLYRNDTVNLAAQAIGQDIVTLLVGLPLLGLSMVLFKPGRLSGKLLLLGTFAYFLYTYTSYAFGVAYNPLFLVYVSLFSLSLFGFILVLKEIDIPALPEHFSSRAPRRPIAIFFFIVCGFLLFDWLGRIVQGLLSNQPPLGLESYTTLIIQALDLGIVVPAAFLSGVLLWRKSAWGYLLSAIVLIKLATLALAVTAMAVNQILAGVQVGMAELIMFPAISFISGGLTVLLLRNIKKLTVLPSTNR